MAVLGGDAVGAGVEDDAVARLVQVEELAVVGRELGARRWCPGCRPCRWAGSGTTRGCRSARRASTRCARQRRSAARRSARGARACAAPSSGTCGSPPRAGGPPRSPCARFLGTARWSRAPGSPSAVSSCLVASLCLRVARRRLFGRRVRRPRASARLRGRRDDGRTGRRTGRRRRRRRRRCPGAPGRTGHRERIDLRRVPGDRLRQGVAHVAASGERMPGHVPAFRNHGPVGRPASGFAGRVGSPAVRFHDRSVLASTKNLAVGSAGGCVRTGEVGHRRGERQRTGASGHTPWSADPARATSGRVRATGSDHHRGAVPANRRTERSSEARRRSCRSSPRRVSRAGPGRCSSAARGPRHRVAAPPS